MRHLDAQKNLLYSLRLYSNIYLHFFITMQYYKTNCLQEIQNEDTDNEVESFMDGFSKTTPNTSKLLEFTLHRNCL